MKGEKLSKSFTMFITPTMHERLVAIAEKERRVVAFIVRDAVEQYINRYNFEGK